MYSFVTSWIDRRTLNHVYMIQASRYVYTENIKQC